jgi:hypothetical protein
MVAVTQTDAEVNGKYGGRRLSSRQLVPHFAHLSTHLQNPTAYDRFANPIASILAPDTLDGD